MDKKVKVSRRGRPPVEIAWPDVVFTAQDIVDTVPEKVSRVTIHSKLNRAVDIGDLTVVGATKTKNGRPRVEYMKTEVDTGTPNVCGGSDSVEQDADELKLPPYYADE